MSWRRHFRAFAQATEPPPGASKRVVERVAWPRTLARTVSRDPAPGAEQRLIQRMRGGRPATTSWRPIALATLVLASAVLTLVLGIERSPAELSRDLTSEAPLAVELTAEVRVELEGSGHVAGTVVAPRVRWESGTLSLDVEPHRGIDLIVETPEGTVRVVGTAFTVVRDALGTSVRVARGEVAVSCVGASAVAVPAGEQSVCLPVRAAGMLIRAQRLLDLGSEPDVVLSSVERGLELATDGEPAVGELLALRIRLLLQAGRQDEALADAERYLAIGGPRSQEVQAVVAALGPQKP